MQIGNNEGNVKNKENCLCILCFHEILNVLYLDTLRTCSVFSTPHSPITLVKCRCPQHCPQHCSQTTMCDGQPQNIHQMASRAALF